MRRARSFRLSLFRGVHLGLARVTLRGQALERWRAIRQALFDHRRIPLAQREHARLDAHERVLFVALLHQRGEARAHRDLWALTNVTEQILLNRYVGDLLVMEGLSDQAQNLRRGFRERHTLSTSFVMGENFRSHCLKVPPGKRTFAPAVGRSPSTTS